MTESRTGHRNGPLRSDIQALRGFAVLAVLLYHLGIPLAPSGFLGVDIFFVVSGFLITSLVLRELDAGSFSLSAFYFRRAKRLLPAAYCTILITSMVAPWFLGQRELEDLSLQVRAAITFTTNHHFLDHAGYFAADTERSPLLHMWSLSLEEQFYFVLPAFLLLLTRSSSRRPFALVAMFVASLLICFGGSMDPSARFYLLPTRAWELLLGAIGAAWAIAPRKVALRNTAVLRILFPAAVTALLVIPALPAQYPHPGVPALVTCLATLCVILRRHPSAEQVPLVSGMSRLGDMSYSLYLVHWPIISLLTNAWMGGGEELPWMLRILGAGLSIGLGYALYRLVEAPLHRAPLRPTPGLILGGIAASLALMLVVPVGSRLTRTDRDFRIARAVNYGLAPACDSPSLFTNLAACRTTETPKVLIWGDSFAMHLVSGFVRHAEGRGIVQATRSSCGPALTVGSVRRNNPSPGPNYDRAFAEACIAFNASVLEYLEHQQSIEVVVLAGAFTSYVDSAWVQLPLDSLAGGSPLPSALPLAIAGLTSTVRAVQAAGKRVLVIAPPPAARFDVAACLERMARRQFTLGVRQGCAIPSAEYRIDRHNVLALMDSLSEAGIPVLRLDDYLCDAARCQTRLGENFLYRDPIHLSHKGSEELAARMDWAGALSALAR